MVSNWTNDTVTTVRDSLSSSLSYIPEVIAALVVILIGVIVAWAVKTVIVRGLAFLKLKKYTDALGLGKVFTEKIEFTELLGDLAKWTIIIIFLIPALDILKLGQVNDVLKSILHYIPNVVIAVVVVMIGLVVADLAARVIRSTAATIGTHTADFLADVAKWAVVVFTVFAALIQLGIAEDMLLSLWQGVIYFFVLAGAIAFGLGGKDAAADLVAQLRKSLPKK